MKHDIEKFDEDDFKYTMVPICPYCGDELEDAWELGCDRDGEETTIECYNCGKEFLIRCNLDITYDTEKVEDK